MDIVFNGSGCHGSLAFDQRTVVQGLKRPGCVLIVLPILIDLGLGHLDRILHQIPRHRFVTDGSRQRSGKAIEPVIGGYQIHDVDFYIRDFDLFARIRDALPQMS